MLRTAACSHRASLRAHSSHIHCCSAQLSTQNPFHPKAQPAGSLHTPPGARWHFLPHALWPEGPNEGQPAALHSTAPSLALCRAQPLPDCRAAPGMVCSCSEWENKADLSVLEYTLPCFLTCCSQGKGEEHDIPQHDHALPLAGRGNKPRAEPTCSHPWGDTARCPTSSRAPSRASVTLFAAQHTGTACPRGLASCCSQKQTPGAGKQKSVPNNRTQTTTAKCLRCRFHVSPLRSSQGHAGSLSPATGSRPPFQHTAQNQCWVTARHPASQTLACSCQEALLQLGFSLEQKRNKWKMNPTDRQQHSICKSSFFQGKGEPHSSVNTWGCSSAPILQCSQGSGEQPIGTAGLGGAGLILGHPFPSAVWKMPFKKRTESNGTKKCHSNSALLWEIHLWAVRFCPQITSFF